MRPSYTYQTFRNASLITIFSCWLLLPQLLQAQPVNKAYNRFQYQKYKWQTLHTEAFHIYFPRGYDSVCAFAAKVLPGAMELIKKRMITTSKKAPNLVIYPSVDQLYASNIGGFELQDYTLPTVVLKGNRLLLAYNGSYATLEEDIREVLVRAVWEEQFANGLETQLTGTAEKLPDWFCEGLIHYFANGWTIADEDALKHLFRAGAPNTWQEVTAKAGKLSGAALCHYLTRKYYPQAATQLYGQLRKKRSLPRALRLVTKTSPQQLFRECFDFYRQRFKTNDNDTVTPKATIKIPAPKGRLQQLLINNNRDVCAYVIQNGPVRIVYSHQFKEGRPQKVISYQLPPWIKDHTPDPYPQLIWNTDNNSLLVAIPHKGKLRIRKYDLRGKELQENTLHGLDGIKSFQTGQQHSQLMAAFRKGQSDIVTYDWRNERYQAHTNDTYDDAQPATDPQSAAVAYSSSRMIRKEGINDKDSMIMVQGIFTTNNPKPLVYDTLPFVQWQQPEFIKEGLLVATTINGTKQFSFLPSSKTANAQTLPVSYQPYGLSPDQHTISFYTKDKDSITIRQYELDQWLAYYQQQTTDTTSPWLEDYQADAAERAREDSILKAARYTGPSFLEGVLTPKNAKEHARHRKDSILQSLQYDPKKITPYILQLHSAYFSAKINNDYFINRFQPYTNYQGQFKFPEPGGMVKGGFTDLFENHHFSLAYRMPAGTEGSDFFVRYENTAKKTDWSLLWFRKVESLQPDPKRDWKDEQGRQYPNSAKVKTNYYELAIHHPLSYYLGIGFNTALRHDRTIFLATEKYSLHFEDLNNTWSISTLALNYNKLRPTLPNLYKGFRAKMTADLFMGIGKRQDATYGAGLDVQYHLPLYRHITFVARAQAGYSGGNKKLLYNMGGVANNLTIRTDSSVHFAQDAPYTFQTLVTPLRGFLQNSIYGDRFGLLNTDVYFPLFQSLIPLETPLSFINNLQPGIFTDIAYARESWKASTSGKTEWSFGLSMRSTLAGYPVRCDIAWPGSFDRQPVWYLSLSLY